MSALASAKPYSQVFDGQKHYRTLLQCMARPGTIGQLDDALLEVPPSLNRATALLALALFSADSSFYLAQGEGAAMDFIRQETAARPVSAGQAEFLLFLDARHLDELRQARQGSLPYPDLGATAVVQVEAISPAPLPDCLRLTLTGPGIEVETAVFVLGAPELLFSALRERNAEFPMGVDAFLTCDSLSAGPCAMALPRTTRVQWERV
jgi:alpha-D-ribose 1-methylphosphonate 5-triphosphate synthase subunit PhnH